jgi:hypothetical protein
MGLNHPPQRLVRQVADFAARPFPVVHFGDPLVDERHQAQRFGERLDGASAAQQRRSHHRPDRQVTDPIDQPCGLLAALVVEVDALGTTRQNPSGVRGGPAVAQQDDGHVAATARC